MSHPTPVKPAPARPAQQTRTVAVPPETLEGWYATHQLYTIDRARLRAMDRGRRAELRARAASTLDLIARPAGGGWTGCVTLIGSRADVMLVHFRPTLDAVGEAERRFAREPFHDVLKPAYSFLSVTEAGLYQVTADAVADAEKRDGKVGDEEYAARIARKAQRELESAHVQKRLYPTPPESMPYVCFYPMSKRRAVRQNWYSLPIAERSRLMYEHGLTGRRYAGKVFQVITGAIGLDAWEWGVTLFAADPLQFKKLVSEMRFDEASAEYADFGDFYVGRLATPEEWLTAITDVADD